METMTPERKRELDSKFRAAVLDEMKRDPEGMRALVMPPEKKLPVVELEDTVKPAREPKPNGRPRKFSPDQDRTILESRSAVDAVAQLNELGLDEGLTPVQIRNRWHYLVKKR